MLEGGYDLEGLAGSVAAHVDALMDQLSGGSVRVALRSKGDLLAEDRSMPKAAQADVGPRRRGEVADRDHAEIAQDLRAEADLAPLRRPLASEAGASSSPKFVVGTPAVPSRR